MAEIITLADRRPQEPDLSIACTIVIGGDGAIKTETAGITTAEQANWLIAQIGAAMSEVVNLRDDLLQAEP